MTTNPLFAAWPYVASGVMVGGVLLRYLLSRRDPEALAAELSQAKEVFAGSRLWRVTLLLLILGHLGVLLFARSVLAWNSNPFRLYLLEGAAFMLGVLCLGSWIKLVLRHLARHDGSALLDLGDTAFLALLFVGILSGLLAAIVYRWGSSWGAMILSPYAISLLHGSPAANLALQMPFLVRLHVFSAFAAMAAFPLTRLSAFPVSAMRYALSWTGRQLSSAGQPVEVWFRKHNPARWLWPEED